MSPIYHWVEVDRDEANRFGKSGLGFSDLAFCCCMTMRDHTRRRQCKTILQLLVGSTYTILHTVLISHPVTFICFRLSRTVLSEGVLEATLKGSKP
ncbi:hypothetical protein TNCV_2003691 [Trichonephila clavipes]|nr:hypothetical protein TNCV_2003691 [Trichonephila clavipes]